MNAGPTPPSPGEAGLSAAEGWRLALRLLGASGVALAFAFVGQALQAPLSLPAGLAPPPPPSPPDEPEAPPAPALPPGEPLVVVALGAFDPSYALRHLPPGAPTPDLFAPLAPLLGPAHFRLIGISSVDTSTPGALTVSGPPVTDEGARLVASGNFDLAVLGHPAYERGGRRALLEGAERLRAAGPSPLGVGATADEALGPMRLLVEGRRVAWLAFDAQPAAPAGAGLGELERRLAALREEGEADAVVVGVHAGERYAAVPSESTRRLFRTIADAGAHVVLGLRPALLQGAEWHKGVPLVYGIGNPLSPSDREHPEAGIAALARLRFAERGPPSVEICPVRAEPRALAPLASDPLRASYEVALWQRVRLAGRPLGGIGLGPVGPDGCAALGPPPPGRPARPARAGSSSP
ncbi:MAG TPA: CapA family protein [Polyangiaceae bacterium]|nr:CapA family protein [Polyangiaceae bacterium]